VRVVFKQDEARSGVVIIGFRDELRRIEIHSKCLPVTSHHRWGTVPRI
jgi:hypothetical protein